MNAQQKWIIGGVAGVALLILLNATLFTVSQTNQALILEFGRPVKVVRDAGLHAKLPMVQNIEYYPKLLLDFYAEPKEVIAADQKRLIVDAFVRYRITDPLKFKQSVADERTMKSRLNAILESSLRQVIGGVPLAAVISEKRATLMEQIRDLVNTQAHGGDGDAQGFGIEVADVRIMRADLPEANSEGIYRRMQTEREREAKEFRAGGAEDAQKIRAQAEKERTILLAEAKQKADVLRGQGEGEAIRIFADATGQDPDFYQFYRTLAAYRKALSRDDTTLVLSPDSGFLKVMERGAGASVEK